MVVRSVLIAAVVASLTITLSARADFVPVSGLLRASATASTASGGTQTNTPPDVVLGSSFGTFTHEAHAIVGGTTSDILVRTVRLSFSLLHDMESDTVFFVNGQAFNSARVEDVFDVTTATPLRIDLEGDSGVVWGLTIRDSSSAVVFDRVTMGGTITEFINLSPGRYSAVSGGGSVGPAALDQTASATLTIVPEPAAIGITGMLVCAVAFARRRAW
jgi:hypothetical protein